jgi:hypothetical protein
MVIAATLRNPTTLSFGRNQLVVKFLHQTRVQYSRRVLNTFLCHATSSKFPAIILTILDHSRYQAGWGLESRKVGMCLGWSGNVSKLLVVNPSRTDALSNSVHDGFRVKSKSSKRTNIRGISLALKYSRYQEDQICASVGQVRVTLWLHLIVTVAAALSELDPTSLTDSIKFGQCSLFFFQIRV